MFDHTAQLVRGWNEKGLLGIDLADMLEDLTRFCLSEAVSELDVLRVLRDVKWAELAETYAWMICNVDEAELTRRRDAA